METKWIALIVMTWLIMMFGGLAVEKYMTAQCKMHYVQSDKPAEEIVKICGQ